jgi:multicomponent Na+:H+ antiporter subunit D
VSPALFNYLPLVAIVLPLAGAIIIALAGRNSPGIRHGVAVATTTTVMLCVLAVAYQRLYVGTDVGLTYEVFSVAENLLLAVRLSAHPIGLVLAVVAAVLWPLTVVYSIGYMAHEHARNRFFIYLVVVQSAAMGICFSGDLLAFFIFYELLTLLVYPLVVHEESEKAVQAGRTYLAYLLFGETLVFAALFIVVGAAGYVPEFTGGGIAQAIGLTQPALWAVLALGFWGFAAKAAVMPMHAWLPDAMIAPTPVSAVLHAVAVVNVGVLGLFMLLYGVVGAEAGRSVGFHLWAPWFAAITIVGASLIALRQDEIKRRLAFSTVSQLGYMVLGASLLTGPGLSAGVLHMFGHSLMKIVLFFCAGTIITQAGIVNFSQIAGLAKRMPVTMACFTVGALGMVGLPPAVGWVSKWALLQASFDAGQYAFVAVVIISAMLNLGYYLPPILAAYFSTPHAEQTSRPKLAAEAPISMLAPMTAITIAVLVLGLWPQLPRWLADHAVLWAMGTGAGG